MCAYLHECFDCSFTAQGTVCTSLPTTYWSYVANCILHFSVSWVAEGAVLYLSLIFSNACAGMECRSLECQAHQEFKVDGFASTQMQCCGHLHRQGSQRNYPQMYQIQWVPAKICPDSKSAMETSNMGSRIKEQKTPHPHPNCFPLALSFTPSLMARDFEGLKKCRFRPSGSSVGRAQVFKPGPKANDI